MSENATQITENAENIDLQMPNGDALLSDDGENALFEEFCRDKNEDVSLEEMYGRYNAFVRDIERIQAYRVAGKKASVGSLAGESPVSDGYFSKEQVMAMSPDDIKKNYEIIRKSQNNW